MNYFGVSTYKTGKLLISNCPIHEGDNKTAFNINLHGEYQGRWFCNTHDCHKIHSGDILGLVWCLLDKQNPTSFKEVLKFLDDFCGDVKVEIYQQDAVTNFFTKQVKKNEGKYTREVVRSKLKIPAQYYLDRGFKPETLDYFDVGLCDDPNREMYNRVVFPVYDEDDKFMVGCVGRTVVGHEEKWKNQKGFNKASYLYNYARAFNSIKETKTIILCEGQGDIMRLHEAGVNNAVGIFGSSLSDFQEFLIQKTGAMNIITLFDNDDAGNKARSNISKNLAKLFNIKHVLPIAEDVGEMSVEQILGMNL